MLMEFADSRADQYNRLDALIVNELKNKYSLIHGNAELESLVF
jgi:hypothetical protein